jgi:hypothetical protein
MHAIVAATLLFGMTLDQPTAIDAFAQTEISRPRTSQQQRQRLRLQRRPITITTTPSSSLLFASIISSSSSPLPTDSSSDFEQALERKNRSRQKFGLKPITPQDFLAIQGQVQSLEMEQVLKQQAAAAAATTSRQQQQQQQQQQGGVVGGLATFAQKLFESNTQDTCISNLDCEQPKICCDLGFKKMCCSSGMKMLETKHELALIRVAQETTGYPPPQQRPRY